MYDLNINHLIKSYFNLYFKPDFIKHKYIPKKKKLKSNNKIFVSKAEIKHTNSKAIITIYVYNRDKSILYFYTKNLYNFLVNLNINYHTYNKHLTNGTYYLRRYLFSKVFEPNAICKLITLLEFADILAKDKKKIKSRKIVE